MATTRAAPAPRPTTSAAGPATVPARGGLILAAAVYAAVTLVLAYPALGGGFLVSPTSDQYIGGYAVRSFGAALWRSTGHLPQWNPYLFGGMPFIGSMNGDIFYPPSVLLRLIARPDVAVTALFVIHEFLAGLFAYVFLRALGMGFAGALVAGLAYMMGGPIASYVSPGHDGKLFVSALFPLMGWALVRGMRDSRAWAWPALALIVGFGILTPHPQLMQYALVGAGAVAVYLAFWGSEGLVDRSAERPVMMRRLGLALVAIGLGLAIGGIQFAPVLEYVKFSPRAGGGVGGYDFSSSYSFPPEELLGTYVPEFFGILDNYWGRTGIHFQSDYLGAAVLALVGASFFSRRRGERWFWIVLGVVTLLWSLGGYTPFFHLIYALVPGTKFFRAPATMFFLTAFAVAALAGQGTDAALEGRVRPVYLAAAVGGAALIALLAVAGGLTSVAGSLAAPERYESVLANAPNVTVGAVRALVAVGATAAVMLLITRGRLPGAAAGWALAAIVAIDLWSVERLYWKWSPPASVTYASNAAIDSVLADREPGRVLTVPTARTAPHDADLEGDALMVHRVRQLLGYHGNQIHRYDALLGREGGEYRRLGDPKVWALLNVRYIYTDLDSLPLPGVHKVVGPVRDAAGSMVSLYRLPGDNPAAWVTPLAVKAPDDQALATIVDPRFPPLVAAVFDTAARVPVTVNPTSLPAPLAITASVTRYDPGHITVALSAPAPAASTLVVSENMYPGWSATVDGHATAVGRVDYTLIGVPLAAGSRSIDLEYRDPMAATGVAITAVAALVALAWLAVGVWAGVGGMRAVDG